MKTAAFVPIKLNNERTPGKNTKKFKDGSPLIHFVLHTLLNSEEVDEIYVYCSNKAIQAFLPDGVRYIKRDKKYDSAQTDVNDLFYSFSKKVYADIYVLAHATAPFQKIRSIDEGIKAVKTGKYDSAFAAREMQEFVWERGAPVNYDPLYIPRTQDLSPLIIETTGLYIFTKDVIQKRRSRIGEKPYMIKVTPVEAVDINNPIDFEIADAINEHIVHGPCKISGQGGGYFFT